MQDLLKSCISIWSALIKTQVDKIFWLVCIKVVKYLLEETPMPIKILKKNSPDSDFEALWQFCRKIGSGTTRDVYEIPDTGLVLKVIKCHLIWLIGTKPRKEAAQ